MNLTQVLIAIQARSSSSRLPGKCYEIVGQKRMLDRVIDSANSAAHFLNRKVEQTGRFVRTCLVVPEADEIENQFKSKVPIIVGPLNDVLTRYKIAADRFKADYIVRITGDCPLIPDHIISKHITIALSNVYDYVGNSDPDCRTAIDGLDCEVFSSRMLEYLCSNAEGEDREHVTTLCKRKFADGDLPRTLRMATTIGHLDQSHIKLSVDTAQDLENVRVACESTMKKLSIGIDRYGKQNVHRV